MICPCCRGSKKAPLLGIRCDWCKGRGTVSRATARQFADQRYMIAGGGFIDGTHDADIMRKMEAEAEGIYAQIGVKPPWQAAQDTGESNG